MNDDTVVTADRRKQWMLNNLILKSVLEAVHTIRLSLLAWKKKKQIWIPDLPEVQAP